MMNDFEILKQNIRDLPERQFQVLSAICCGMNSGHHPRTLEALERKELIVLREATVPGWPPVTVKVPDLTSVRTHLAWCEVACERDPQVEENARP